MDSSRYFKTAFSRSMRRNSSCVSSSWRVSNSICPSLFSIDLFAVLNSFSRKSSFNCSWVYRGWSVVIELIASGNLPRCPFMRAACTSEYNLPCDFISTISAKTSISSSEYMRVLFLPGLAWGLRYAANSLEYARTDSREILKRFAVWIAFHMRNIVAHVTNCYQIATESPYPTWQIVRCLLQSLTDCTFNAKRITQTRIS